MRARGHRRTTWRRSMSQRQRTSRRRGSDDPAVRLGPERRGRTSGWRSGARWQPTCRRYGCSRWRPSPLCITAMDAGGIDLAILDGEAVPGGMGLCRQLKDEILRCPPILVLIGRAGRRLAGDLVAGRRRGVASGRSDPPAGRGGSSCCAPGCPPRPRSRGPLCSLNRMPSR